METKPLVGILLFAAACDPYLNRSGEFNAGAVDPASFPSPYLGTGGNRSQPGKGVFTEIGAFVGSTPIGYFSFPFSTQQNNLLNANSTANPPLAHSGDPLRLFENGTSRYLVPSLTGTVALPTPNVYQFDSSACVAPAGYKYDPYHDDVHYDQQYPVFTALPSETLTPGFPESFAYIPLITPSLTHAHSQSCQAFKSEATLLQAKTSGQVKIDAPVQDAYLAWPIIDVGAGVYRVGQSPTDPTKSGWTVQHLGWYNHFLLAYLDGGAVPTITYNANSCDPKNPDPNPSPSPCVAVPPALLKPNYPAPKLPITEVVTQNLYYPTSAVLPAGGKNPTTGTANLGVGWDVLEHARADATYSPVCAVFSYDTGATTMMPDMSTSLPTDSATIVSKYPKTLKFQKYIYCLQVL
jgi:hypothetical protein